MFAERKIANKHQRRLSTFSSKTHALFWNPYPRLAVQTLLVAGRSRSGAERFPANFSENADSSESDGTSEESSVDPRQSGSISCTAESAIGARMRCVLSPKLKFQDSFSSPSRGTKIVPPNARYCLYHDMLDPCPQVKGRNASDSTEQPNDVN